MEYKVNTIYPAFMGEVNVYGIGAPCTFIRLSGCNLRCYRKTLGILCDTPEALSGETGKTVSLSEIMDIVKKLGNDIICLTGGEPLMSTKVKSLLEELSAQNYKVVVETNGTRSIEPYRHIANVSFVVDFKSPSTGEMDRMIHRNFHILNENDFIKFVLYDYADYQTFKSWYASYAKIFKGKISVGLFWGGPLGYQELLEILQKDNIKAYLNMQTHKMICGYDHYRKSEDFKTLFIPKNL